MYWMYLFIAGLFEISWAVGLKFTHGFSQIIPSVLTVIGMIASFYFLALALKHLPLGVAYAIWTGIGTIGTVIFGIIIFKEPVTAMRLVCIALIVSGITGLKLLGIEKRAQLILTIFLLYYKTGRFCQNFKRIANEFYQTAHVVYGYNSFGVFNQAY